MKRQIILGMGAGQCGTLLLAQILDRQFNSRVSHEQPPLLPWAVEPDGPGIRERLQRILDTRTERFVGDVATFYLPYLEEAIRFRRIRRYQRTWPEPHYPAELTTPKARPER